MTNKIKGLPDAKTIKAKGFDFDYWCELAKQDPEAFEQAREQEISNYIGTLNDESAQERLRRLQWRVEMERKLSKNPMDSAVRLYDMMWDSVSKNYEALQELAKEFTPPAERSVSESTIRTKAKVLKFKKEEEADATVC